METLNTAARLSTSLDLYSYVQRLNEIMVAYEYLRLHYAWGEDSAAVAAHLGLPAGATEAELVEEVASRQPLTDVPFWAHFGSDYSTGRVVRAVATMKTIVASLRDQDGDRVIDRVDNCRTVANPSQADWDGNGIGDACDSTVGPNLPDYTDPLTGMTFAYVPPGTFQMGDTFGDGWDGERPVHTVTLTRGYYLGQTEVTQAQWQAVMGSNPSYFQPSRGYPACPTCPVEQVLWNDIQVFVTNLNAQTGRAYRLPTEAEWEYAAKGGPYGQGYKYAVEQRR